MACKFACTGQQIYVRNVLQVLIFSLTQIELKYKM
nr:MAG TPA: hypothetical protein [Caudoviricetes sp.]